ncbi:GntR family transcriptional regulator [Candidatus Contubernalis alkaliaceticus]|uniref:GntR family transcriptional regulator n=1 Tax=Candidatus Contubernalis alkaliaceticus TaxID=338645 RepID=UPI001F4C3F79|nr:GntR family transcriptional regulator [Candidatus Contubernalis alkalaceticus]UNC91973.1 GntR family transcriptional regulator [Candidatus Contubernalis alkalaceticus]
MHFYLLPSSGIPIYKQIIKQIKHSAAGGLLNPGDQLPSVRELSENLTINPNTVSKAYQELEREGIINIIHGVGTFVSKGKYSMEESQKEDLMKNSIRQLFTESFHLGLSQERLKILFLEEYENGVINRKGE